MKKTLAMLCVIALIAITTVPALANPSITNQPLEIAAPVEADNGLTCATADVNPDKYTEAVAEVVAAVNGNEVSLTPEQIVDSEGLQIAEAPDGFAVADYRFVTPFVDLVALDGNSHEGEELNATVTLQCAAMQGVTADTISQYMVMQINPVNGDIYFIPIKIDDNGAFVVTLAIVGPFAIIQKI